MARVALLTSANMTPGAAQARADVHEFVLQFQALAPACRARLIALESVVWDGPGTDWRRYDAVVIGTAWDYWDRPEAFLDALAGIEATGTRLFNPLALVRWNLDKGYLGELAARGAAVIPTLYAARADMAAIAPAFDVFGTDVVVVKERVGASAERLALARRGQPLPPAADLPRGRCLIQPYLPSVAAWGELSFLFYDRLFSHAVRKIPAAGDFRVQSVYGGRETNYTPSKEEMAQAAGVIAAIPGPLLYARVDMARDASGRLAVMEVELIEPYHYPEQGRFCGAHFAAALDRMLSP